MQLNLFRPTKTRDFTYYDKCAIQLDEDEMMSVRVRIFVSVLTSPLERYLNYKYREPVSWFGTCQTYWQNNTIDDYAIRYRDTLLIDYWNEHGTNAHQMADVLQRLKIYLIAMAVLQIQAPIIANQEIIDAMNGTLVLMQKLDWCYTWESDDGDPDLDDSNNFINTFQTPFNLLRFQFPFGTVFQVKIESWSLGLTSAGTLPGNPQTADEYSPENPGDRPPDQSPPPGSDNYPYGYPGASSPRDPDLDPDDFSNAPDPEPPPNTVNLQGWSCVAIPGAQTAGFFVGCPGASLAVAIPSYAGVRNPTDMGVHPIRVDSQGRVSSADVLAAFPGFQFGNNVFAADTSCGVNGTADF